MEKRKLELKRKTISVLSDDELKKLDGGLAEPVTTSFGNCTGFLCCGDTESIGIAISIAIGIATTLTHD